MASTNKTSNYNLSQYIGSDKPTYLGDYNNDMLKIDNGMEENKTMIETAQSDIETAQNTANNALTKATNNETSITSLQQYFNLKNQLVLNEQNLTCGQGTIFSNRTAYIQYNDAGTLAKFIGNIAISVPQAGNVSVNVNTNLHPSGNIGIPCAGMVCTQDRTLPWIFNLNINTNGAVEFIFSATQPGIWNIMLGNQLMFLNDWNTPGNI